MTAYHINDPRQGLIGPVHLDTVRDLVSAGVLQDDVLVSKDGGPWLLVGTFGEIFGHPESAATASKPTFAGDLGKHSAFRVFYRFHYVRATGLLRVRRGGERRDIYFEAGVPTFVASNNENERFGQFLLRAGRIDADELDVALRAMTSDGNRLGATLVRLGLLDEAEVLPALIAQQHERLVGLCQWSLGHYQFFDGQFHSDDKLDLELMVEDLVLQAARTMELGTLLDRLADELDLVVSRRPHSELDSGAFSLTRDENRALGLIDGLRTVRELVGAQAEMDARRAALTVLLLLREIDAATFTLPG